MPFTGSGRAGWPTNPFVSRPQSPYSAGMVMRVWPFESLAYHSANGFLPLTGYAPMLAISMPTERLLEVVACHARSLVSGRKLLISEAARDVEGGSEAVSR